jgi:NitT/TauT family transport system ATP-binding protein
MLRHELLGFWQANQTTVLFVTHSVTEAVFLSNRIFVMSSHPGRFHAEVKVDFAYPRRAGLRAQPEFQQLVNEVSRLLHQVEEGAA